MFMSRALGRVLAPLLVALAVISLLPPPSIVPRTSRASFLCKCVLFIIILKLYYNMVG
jgi:hypothetical protein